MNSNELERKQLDDYDVFNDREKFARCKIPRGFILIQVYTIFDIKVDYCQKRHVVADELLRTALSESVYSRVVSLRGLHTCVFIGDLDGIVPWVTNIDNTYLEAVTSEKVCTRDEPEFGELEGHLLIIYKVCISYV